MFASSQPHSDHHRQRFPRLASLGWIPAVLFLFTCGGGHGGNGNAQPVGNGMAPGGALTTLVTPAPGNPTGQAAIPTEADVEDVSNPTTVVGTGTPESCTPEALEAAIHKGGIVTFNPGPKPVTITLDHTIKIINNAGVNKNGDLIIDGGGKVTLSGGGRCRILYQNGCDQAQVWITDHCDNYPHPRLVLQNLIFADGYATDGGTFGGGAVFVESGQLKVVNCVFVRNQCALTGQDVAGGALYAFMVQGPVYLTRCTFGGSSALGNKGSHGGAIGTIGVSYTALNCLFSYNQATGHGQNSGTPGGGNGGAIYNDGNTYTLTLKGCDISNNTANELAGGLFYVSNNSTGSVTIDQCRFHANPGLNVQSRPGFFIQGATPVITNTAID
jgi:hypothetical protein